MQKNKTTHTIHFPEQNHSAEVRHGENLLDVIHAQGVYIEAPCGGMGRCGKCKALVDGTPCLACKTLVTKDMQVTVPDADAAEGYEILADSGIPGTTGAAGAEGTGETGYAVAIDIGTTTVISKLIDLSRPAEAGVCARINAQRPYGADVITRINRSMDDASELSALIRAQLCEMTESLLAQSGVPADEIRRVVVAGNTTMSYLLLGLPCRSLGLSPFQPAYPIEDAYSYRDVFASDRLSCPVYVLPYISSFVGGDLASGLLALEGRDNFMLIDMGTNGELVYRYKGKLLCTSTAAGPAFEGGNISCGMGGTEGAISKVSWKDGGFAVTTIGGKQPVGVCGSGILDLMACLAREGIIEASGRFSKECGLIEDASIAIARNTDTCQEIRLTQKDVREFQLAKSAVRTGLEILVHEADGTMPEQVYLAGGFGQHLSPESAFATGLLPESLAGRVHPVGNSSLAGAVIACIDTDVLASARRDIGEGRELNLAKHPLFNDQFLEHMVFEYCSGS
jgi:uncharacterized 2Fe-2S/4Fe-4S cluster protein (DUF4445 family)